VFLLKCTVCGAENPDKNQFCSSCGKPLPKPQPLKNAIPSGAGQVPVPATPKKSGSGLILVAGGALFLIVVILVGLFVILPLFEEETPSWEDSGIPSSYDLTDPEDFDQTVDSPASMVSGYGEKQGTFQVTATTTMRVSQPVRSSSSASPDDFIIGTWDIESSDLQMQFSADGAATMLDPISKEYATGSWEKIADGKYRLRSPSGKEYPVLLLDPIAGTMHLEDYSLVFVWKGDN
jgi:hypothetical protein